MTIVALFKVPQPGIAYFAILAQNPPTGQKPPDQNTPANRENIMN